MDCEHCAECGEELPDVKPADYQEITDADWVCDECMEAAAYRMVRGLPCWPEADDEPNEAHT